MSDPSFFASWREENAAAVASRRSRLGRLVPAPLRRRAGSPLGERLLRRGRRGVTMAVAAATVATGLSLVHGDSAFADPSADAWYRLRMCESSDDYAINTGNAHYGAYQFDLVTWRSVGGSGYPNLASPAEQDARALILYRLRGWQPWQCASILGLREDSDARSGIISDITVPTTSAATGGLTFPSSGWAEGAENATIARFQLQMGTRGAPLTGTGQFGPKTLAVIRALQRANGRAVTGRLDQATYDLAFHGSYGVGSAAVKVPAFPRGAYYGYGDDNSVIATFQRQLGKRGADLTGTGQFGPKTVAAIKRLQAGNGLPASGDLGARTFRLAWLGRY